MTREEAVQISGKLIERTFPSFKKFVDHEAEHGHWLPEKYTADPGMWLTTLEEVLRGFKEYINNKEKIHERYITRDVGSVDE